MKFLLISIKPKYAKKIFTGQKKFEFRKTRPNVGYDDVMFIYETSPTKAIKGFAFIQEIWEDKPQDLWPRVKDHAGITKEEFFEYYNGSDKAYAILIKDLDRIAKPIKLQDLRKKFGITNPPQSYKYLTQEEFQFTKSYIIPLQLWFSFLKRDFYKLWKEY